MMTIPELKNVVMDNFNEVSFSYNNKKCGILLNADNEVIKFLAFCGESEKEYQDFDKLIADSFFDGKSILEIINMIEIDIC